MECEAPVEQLFRKIQKPVFIESVRRIGLEFASVRVGTEVAVPTSKVVEVGVLHDFFENVSWPREDDGCQDDAAYPADALFRVSYAPEELFRQIRADDFVLRILGSETGIVECRSDEKVGLFLFGYSFDVGQIRSARVHLDRVTDVVVGVVIDFFDDPEGVRPGFREDFSFRHLERFRTGKIGGIRWYSTARERSRNLFLTRAVFLLPLCRFVPSLSQKMTIVNMNDEMSVRLARLEKIRSLGISAYPEKFEKTHSAGAILADAEGKDFRTAEEVVVSSGTDVSVAGRVVLFRSF